MTVVDVSSVARVTLLAFQIQHRDRAGLAQGWW
jgi:hypothetical protein